jgi:hypothetical protein
LGFLGITGGFVLKNPIPETLTGHELQAVTGVLGVYFNYWKFFKIEHLYRLALTRVIRKNKFQRLKITIKTPKTPFLATWMRLLIAASIESSIWLSPGQRKQNSTSTPPLRKLSAETSFSPYPIYISYT